MSILENGCPVVVDFFKEHMINCEICKKTMQTIIDVMRLEDES
jgi:hypothetical protein